MESERIRQSTGVGVGGITPGEHPRVGSVDVLLEIELRDRTGIAAIGETQKDAGQAEAHVTCLFGVAERAPLGVFRRREALP
jgi:hypothetical protein